MTVRDGAVRSHSTAPTHAVMTQPAPLIPHQVSSAIATPIGPKSSHPRSSGGKIIRAASGRMVPSMTTPAKPANSSARHARPPSRTRSAGVIVQKIQTGISDTAKSRTWLHPWCSAPNAIRSRTPIIVRYRTNHVTPRHNLPPQPNGSRRQALAKMPAMVIDIGMPHTRKLATPKNVQLDRRPDARPKAARTWSVSGDARPSCRLTTTPGLALSANPVR
ncbi:hypothetical protein [Mycolicibacterium phocaicum]|uniref:hypothetical protein n=1 Tax=Mycolicibacterium phocaicum TaxID=319706 RepID=UPI0013D091A0|nr:hypothetical protein [Mycolicibacterium phocaicum]